MKTDTDELIDKLAKDLRPVRPLLPAPLRAACLCALCLMAVFGGLFAVAHGLRPDLAAKLAQPSFAVQSAAMLLAGILSALAACQLSVPDTRIRWHVQAALGVASCIWLGLLGAATTASFISLVAAVSGGHSLTDFGATTVGEGDCLSDLSLLLVAPLAAVLFMITRGAPVWRGWAGYATVLSAASFAALGMRFLCPNDDAGHLLVWHFLPVMGYAILGIALGKILLRAKVAKI